MVPSRVEKFEPAPSVPSEGEARLQSGLIVALCFSGSRPRGLYLQAKIWVDRIAAGAIAALGLSLIFAHHRSGI
jgi:hypothetical protein